MGRHDIFASAPGHVRGLVALLVLALLTCACGSKTRSWHLVSPNEYSSLVAGERIRVRHVDSSTTTGAFVALDKFDLTLRTPSEVRIPRYNVATLQREVSETQASAGDIALGVGLGVLTLGLLILVLSVVVAFEDA